MIDQGKTDANLDLLLDYAQNRITANNNVLWLLDENTREPHLERLHHILPHHALAITNRYDLYAFATRLNLNCQFSDFDIEQLDDLSLDYAFYRISKEKAVTHHLLNALVEKLKPGASMILAGEKSDGIKTYVDKAKAILGFSGTVRKHKNTYIAQLTREREAIGQRLDDHNYRHLQIIDSPLKSVVWSKPGCYGWNKVDVGSELLVAAVLRDIADRTHPIKTVLDLGCGYGYLSLALAEAGVGNEFIATDNNAAALTSCKKNMHVNAVNGRVYADDCAAHIDTQVALVVCNPPFHKGFNTDAALTDNFLHAASRCLQANGYAYFVTNRFIAIENKAIRYFRECDPLAETGQFKVLRFSGVRKQS